MSVPLGCSPQLKKLALSALKGRREGVKSWPWRQTAEVQYQAAPLTSSTHCWASYSPLCLSFLICKKTYNTLKCQVPRTGPETLSLDAAASIMCSFYCMSKNTEGMERKKKNSKQSSRESNAVEQKRFSDVPHGAVFSPTR